MLFSKLFEKGKAKIYPGQPSHQQHQQHPSQYPPQAYPPQTYPPQAYPPSPYQSHPQGQYQYPQQQPYTPPPPGPYAPPYSPPPNQYAPPPPTHPNLAPPIPHHSRPATTPPPLPSRPPAHTTPSSIYALTTPRESNPYWTAEFLPSTPVHHNFRHETGAHGWGNNEAQNYTNSPENSFHNPDSSLTIRAIANNGVYTSARLTSHQLLARPRGYVVATLFAPSAKGIWPAFWLLPADPFTWPGDGEIDIFEAWDGGLVNHSCLHWGHYNGEDWNKHRVLETPVPELRDRPHSFGLAWSEEDGIPGWRGRLMWYIDGRPVMKAQIPSGVRRMEDYRILLNVAMGGNVNSGRLPDNGVYDLVVKDLKMCDIPPGGWDVFEGIWGSVQEGKTM